MTVEEYRKKHKSCRYCEHNHAEYPELEMECRAKTKYGSNRLPHSWLRAYLCKMYSPDGYWRNRKRVEK